MTNREQTERAERVRTDTADIARSVARVRLCLDCAEPEHDICPLVDDCNVLRGHPREDGSRWWALLTWGAGVNVLADYGASGESWRALSRAIVDAVWKRVEE